MTSVEAGRRAGRPRVSSKPLVQADRLVVTMLAGLFVLLAGMFAAGAAAFTTLSGQFAGMQEQTSAQLLAMQEQTSAQLLDMQKQTSAQLLDMQKQTSAQFLEMQKQIGGLSERMARIETALLVHHGPLPGP